MPKKNAPSTSTKMRQIDMAYTDPTPEQKTAVPCLLERNDAMDLAPILGLEVTNPESSSDTKVAV